MRFTLVDQSLVRDKHDNGASNLRASLKGAMSRMCANRNIKRPKMRGVTMKRTALFGGLRDDFAGRHID